MKLPEAKIELGADDTVSRYTLNAVQLDVPNKRIMATNGHILAIVPCEVSDTDHSALLSLESIKQMRAMQKRAKSIPIQITTNGKVTATFGGESQEHELATGTFPRVDMVIPKGEKYEGPATITLNVALLLRLAKAIGAQKDTDNIVVSLTVRDSQSAVLVKTSNNPDAIGVIMPYRP